MTTQQSGYQSALRDEEGWHDLKERAERLRNRAKELREIDATLKDIDNLFANNLKEACERLRIALTRTPDDAPLLKICANQGKRLLESQQFTHALEVAEIGLCYGRGDLLTELRSLSYVARLLQAPSSSRQNYGELIRNAERLDSLEGINSENAKGVKDILLTCYTDLLANGYSDKLLLQLQVSITRLFLEESGEQFEKLKTKIEEIRSETEKLAIRRLQERAENFFGETRYDDAIKSYAEALELAERRTLNRLITDELITEIQKDKDRTELHKLFTHAQALYQESLQRGEPLGTLSGAETACTGILAGEPETTDIVSRAGDLQTKIAKFREEWQAQQSALKDAKVLFAAARISEPLQAINLLNQSHDSCEAIQQAIPDYSDVKDLQKRIKESLYQFRSSLATRPSVTTGSMHELAEMVAHLQPDPTFVLSAEFKESLAVSIAAEVARLQPAPTVDPPVEHQGAGENQDSHDNMSIDDGADPSSPSGDDSSASRSSGHRSDFTTSVGLLYSLLRNWMSKLFSSKKESSKDSSNIRMLVLRVVIGAELLLSVLVVFVLPSGNPPSQVSSMGGTAAASTAPASRATATASNTPTSSPTPTPTPTITPTSTPTKILEPQTSIYMKPFDQKDLLFDLPLTISGTAPLNVKLTITLSDIEVPQPTPDPTQNSTSVPAPKPVTVQVKADDKGYWTWDTTKEIPTTLTPGRYEIRVDVEGGTLGTPLPFTVLPAVPASVPASASLRNNCNESTNDYVYNNTEPRPNPLEIVGKQDDCYRVRKTGQRQLYWALISALPSLDPNQIPNIPK